MKKAQFKKRYNMPWISGCLIRRALDEASSLMIPCEVETTLTPGLASTDSVLGLILSEA